MDLGACVTSLGNGAMDTRNCSKTMNTTSRRAFLKSSAVAVAATTWSGGVPSVVAAGANERIQLGIIGPGGMGMNLLRSFAPMPDVQVGWVCDPDENRARAAAREVEDRTGRPPRVVADLRRVLEDNSVDAVIIATPDHWHAPATILACDAGKHVYVEKPASHNLREGRLMIDAARKAKRVVQVGTQSRSSPHVLRAMELLKQGVIGDILVAKVWNSQLRRDIGHATPTRPPAELDFDLWLGPAPAVPYRSNLLHSQWRWFRAFGTGDMGNDGVHDIDIALWGLGVVSHPNRIVASGGKYFFDDDQEFPDTQTVIFEYGPPVVGGRPRQLIFEQRIWSPYVQEGHENGNAFYGTKGYMILGKGGGWQIFGPRNQPGESMKGTVNSLAHHRNFLECLRTGALPNADIEIGHLSSSLCHLGNIATQTGRALTFDPVKERFKGDSTATRLLHRQYRKGHWAVPVGAS